MFILLSATVLYSLLFVYLIHKKNIETENKRAEKIIFWVVTASSFLVRIAISYMSEGYKTDMNCFRSWASTASGVLPWDFYDSVWCDYPPGYIYVLSVVGALKRIFPFAGDVFIKLPATICDILCAVMVCKIATENKSELKAESAGIIMVLNVATIINSALWGQVDSVFTLVLLLSFVCLYNKKYYKSAVLLGIAVLLKIQALMFVPVYLFAVAELCFSGDVKKSLLILGKSLLITLAVIVAGALPFVIKKGPAFLINLYFGTASQYPYASLNAFNFFSLLEANLKENSEHFMLFTYKIWGIINICISVVISGVLYLKGRGKGKLFYTGAVLISLIYAFSSDMHERYLFPAIILFFVAAVIDNNKKTAMVSLGISLSQIINVGYLYYLNMEGTVHIPSDDIVLITGSLFTVILIVYGVWLGFKEYIPEKEKEMEIPDGKNRRITKKDTTVILIMTIIYAMVSFINLGDIKIPATKGEDEIGDGWNYVTAINFEKEENIGKVVYYQGLGTGQVAVFGTNDKGEWEQIAISEEGDVYRWQQVAVDIKAKKIMIAAKCDEQFELCEVGVIEKDTDKVIKINMNDNKLFDEQELVSAWDTYKNGTYFDEIYHARTAYEHIEGIYPYEISHPPLGKLIISLGIRMFGMNPFGWRFMGNMIGILMIPLMYIFAKRIFGKSDSALYATLFLMFDFMHFTQTRIATIDSFSVFFIMIMYYFMYIYYSDEGISYRKSLIVLALCGIFFGIGISTKWICVYAGAGLAVLYSIATIKRAKKGFPWFKTCLWCVLFFVVIPLLIYFLSYIPYYMADRGKNAFEIFWENQKFMFEYHSRLTATHPFQSKWYTWPAVLRPIWYYGAQGGLEDGMVSSIVALGNPAVWWCGTISALVIIFKRRKTPFEWFVIISYLSQFAPWMIVNRAVFIYHYFASVPFIILALTYGIDYLKRRYKNGVYMAVAFITIVICLFIMFYPVLSGMEISRTYVNGILRWFGTWTLSY